MKKIIYAVLMLTCISNGAKAAPGDSTWVQANNRRFDRGNGYGSYDTAVAFPSGLQSYRKIYMVFTLGKYACAGYNPNNPGDQAGQTGWCGDWDYTVQNILMTPTGDTVELGRFMTPYARETWPSTPQSFSRRYVYDVTDYYPLLKNNATMRVFYSGYSVGFTGNVKFLFVEGLPDRQVQRIDRVWHNSYAYGHGATPINAALSPISRTAPAGTLSAELKLNVTGHGGDDNSCAEFCPNQYMISLNGNTLVTQPFFRDNCSVNDLYPQSGTWILARANWCPGALVNTFSHGLTGVNGGSSYSLGMSFPAYTSTTVNANTSPASYTIDGAVIYYGSTNKSLDASIEDIIAPTKAEYHFRQNPTADRPILSVRNSGATAISSITFQYGLAGRLQRTYTWNGSLASMETKEISLAPLGQLRIEPGDYGFVVSITQVNGKADDDALNNTMRSVFTAAPTWPADIQILLKTNSEPHPILGGSISQTAWRIEDAVGNIVNQKSDCGLNATCDQTLHLSDGAYRLIVTDSNFYGYYNIPTGNNAGYWSGTGLSAITAPSAGSIRVFDVNTGLSLTMRGNFSGSFSGDFGGGFSQAFIVGGPLAVASPIVEAAYMNVFPNPAANALHVVIGGMRNSAGMVTITDMVGRQMSHQEYANGTLTLDVSALPRGVYTLSYTNAEGSKLQKRVTITR